MSPLYILLGSRGVWGYIHHSGAGYLTTDNCTDSDPIQEHDQNSCTLKIHNGKYLKIERKASQLWRRWNNKIISMNLQQSKVVVILTLDSKENVVAMNPKDGENQDWSLIPEINE